MQPLSTINLRQKHVLNSIQIVFTYSILEHRYVRTESIYSGLLLCVLLYLTCDLSIYMMVLLKYLDGTTDITRTIHFGKPSPHEKSSYTAVCEKCSAFLWFQTMSAMHDGVKFHNESSDFRLLLLILSMSGLLPHLVTLPLDHSRSVNPFKPWLENLLEALFS